MMHKSKRGRGPVATAAYSAKGRLASSKIEEKQDLASFVTHKSKRGRGKFLEWLIQLREDWPVKY